MSPVPLPILGGRRRHVWTGPGRVHVHVHRPTGEDATRFDERLHERLSAHARVRWVDTVGVMGHVVVAVEGGDPPVDALIDAIEDVEAEFATSDAAPGVPTPPHPADPAAIQRGAIRLGASVLGLGLATARPLAPWGRPPWVAPAATALSMLEHQPRLHRVADRVLGVETAEVVLAVLDAAGQGLAASPLGLAVDVAHRNSQLRAMRARRVLWEQHEADLFDAGPTGHPTVAVEARPVPVPPGVVERLADRALLASLGGAGVALAVTRVLPWGTGVLLAGLPKAATHGRDAFAAHVGRILADRELLLPLRVDALRLLDRVDWLAVDRDVLMEPPPRGRGAGTVRGGAQQLVDAARAGGLRVAVLGRRTDALARLGPDRFLRGGTAAGAAVRRLQVEGSVVLVVAPGGSPALPAADVALGLWRAGAPPPLQADVLALDDDLVHATALVSAAASSRTASHQDAVVARIGAIAAVAVSFVGLPSGAPRRALDAVNTATIVTLANSHRLALQLQRRVAPLAAVEPTPVPGRQPVAV